MSSRRTAEAAVAFIVVAIACHSAERVPPRAPEREPAPSERPEAEEDRAEPEGQPEERERAARDADPEPRERAVEDADRYVAPDGDDGDDGTADAPWRSLQRAAEAAEPGMDVAVREGHYEGFELKTSGEPDAPIRFAARGEVRIEDPSTVDGINLEGASHVELRGFRVRGAERAGIRAVECEGVEIRENRLDRNGKWGILTGFCDDLDIRENFASRSREQHGIYVGNSSERPRVRGNRAWGNPRAGIHMNGDESLGGDGVISEARIEGNVLRQNGSKGAAAINLDGVVNSVIANNLIYQNRSAGVALYQIDGGAPSTGNAVIHNTVVMGTEASRWALLLKDGAQNTALYNNILIAADPRRGAIAASRDSLRGLRSDGNVFTDPLSAGGAELDLAAWRELTGQDEQSSDAPEPSAIFANPGNGDFRLAEKSPIRGEGRPLPASLRERAGRAADRDRLGAARAQQRSPDPGCFSADGARARAGAGAKDESEAGDEEGAKSAEGDGAEGSEVD